MRGGTSADACPQIVIILVFHFEGSLESHNSFWMQRACTDLEVGVAKASASQIASRHLCHPTNQTTEVAAHLQLVGMTMQVLALRTDVKVLAHGAPPTEAWLDFSAARVASSNEGRGLGVVNVVEHHHRRVLGSPQGVELIPVALAEREELLQVQARKVVSQKHLQHCHVKRKVPSQARHSTGRVAVVQELLGCGRRKLPVDPQRTQKGRLHCCRRTAGWPRPLAAAGR